MKTKAVPKSIVAIVGEARAAAYSAISKSIDADFYRSQLEVPKESEFDPALHYIIEGVLEGLDPHPTFDTKYYVERNPDVYEAGVNPYFHYLIQGHKEARPSRASKVGAAANIERTAMADGYEEVQDEVVRAILRSGLFDIEWYRSKNSGIDGDSEELVRHYLSSGERQGFQPNSIFSPNYYTKHYFDKIGNGGPLFHYVSAGDSEGLRPAPYFLPDWYRSEYGIEAAENALFHYIRNKKNNQHDPCPYFDSRFYLAKYEDVASSGGVAFEHWYNWGIKEGRQGSEKFDGQHVWREYLGGDLTKHPLDWFIELGTQLGWTAIPDTTRKTVHSEVRAFAAEGPLFEYFNPRTIPDIPNSVKAIAYYLTQFHAIPENDEWWGKGFTEWRNIPRGLPRFEGHYQPRIPRDLGYYDLSDVEIMRKQVALAAAAGLHGFCFYYYNFAGHRLLETPLNQFVSDEKIDYPFCLLWANENWSRRWDGYDAEVLIRQDYSHDHLVPLVDDLAKYLKHKNYISIKGRPVFGIYRVDVIPDMAKVLAEIRRLFIERHRLDVLMIMAQAFGAGDPRSYGFDAAVEFPPHKIGVIQSELQKKIKVYDKAYAGKVIGYDEAVDFALKDQPTEYPLIKTAFPSWDNDPRKQGSGMAFVGSTPEKFERWMDGNIAYAKARPVFGESIVFVNAWNEWCEGAYLEPDCHFGFAYLNALNRSLARAAGMHSEFKMLLVGHDAFRAGAQQLLLAIGTNLMRKLNVGVEFVLLGGGAMLPEYNALAPTFVIEASQEGWSKAAAHLAAKKAAGFGVALTNSAVSGQLVDALKEQGLRVVSLIHELPTIIKEYNIQGAWEAIRTKSDVVVFPNNYVEKEVTSAFASPVNTEVVRPQGIYKKLVRDRSLRERALEKLGLPSTCKVVLNMGYADYRKGIDLFLGVAEKTWRLRRDIHFVWVGQVQEQLGNWIARDVAQKELKNVHLLPFDFDVSPYLNAADVFFLSSREDPFPSVVLEASAVGVPVVCFDWGGGYVDFVAGNREFGVLAEYGNVDDATVKILSLIDEEESNADAGRNARSDIVTQRFSFDTYCQDIVTWAFPAWMKITAIVPNYNYGRYIPSRIDSIVHQSYPVADIVVLDDASTDGSQGVITHENERLLQRCRLHFNASNSGNVFRQWRRGVDMATSELVWIAEADDSAKPNMLEKLAAQLYENPDAHFAFCDSVAVDSNDVVCYESYKGYYASLGDDGLSKDGVFDSREFADRFLSVRNLILNASSVVWRRSSLIRALEKLGDSLYKLRCAGDWLVYLAACSSPGKVCYLGSPLNVHRRHHTSVTHSQDKRHQIKEIQAVHKYYCAEFCNDTRLQLQKKYLHELVGQFNLADS